MDSKQKRLNELVTVLQGLDPSSDEYARILIKAMRENIGLAGQLARTFKLYLEWNEHNSFFFEALILAIPKFDPSKGDASSLIISIAKGLILNQNRKTLRENAKKRENKDNVQYYLDTAHRDRLCCDLYGNVIEVRYYDRGSD